MVGLRQAVVLTILALSSLSSAFYLPGVAPTDYEAGQQVPLTVNRLTPQVPGTRGDKRLSSVLSYNYYHPLFKFCRPKDGPKKMSESLGSILFGDRILSSPFEIYMAKNETCKVLCHQTYDVRSTNFVNSRILENNYQHWLIDQLPAATLITDQQKREYYSIGFPLGDMGLKEGGVGPNPSLNNHFDIVIDYHELAGRTPKKYRVVGVIVQPSSRHSKESEDGKGDCSNQSPVYLKPTVPEQVVFTYSIYWRPSKTPWATRWDKYLQVDQPQIHWFSLINSAVIVVFLSGTVATTLLRALRKDIARYNQFDLDEDVQEDSGWKLVHGDVFRPPRHRLLLSIFLGSGAQLFFVTGATIVFALVGFLSPSSRGALGTMMIVFHMLFGFVGGYVSTRVYKTFGGEDWKMNIILTPLFVPGVVFATFFIMNFFLILERSSGAVPFGTMVGLIGLWFVISLPLSFAGSWMGLKKPAVQAPVRTNQIPRQIPHQPSYFKPIPSLLLGGALPFLAIMTELYFIMNSIWFDRVYYMFGFLFLCYGIMIMTCATVTVLMIYFLLCSENYHWQWRAFYTSGASALYIFLNALIWWVAKLRLGGFTSNMLYLTYSALISFLVFVLTGTIGFFASYFFVYRIYNSIKID